LAGTLHHVMGRGLRRATRFPSDDDRADFVARVAALARDGHWVVYAWALMPNHFHLVVRTGQHPLFQSMRKLLTGYVVNFNRRHQRFGHLFQKGMEYDGAEAALFLGVTTSAVNRLALSAELPEFREFVKML
jgi:REP element-mobilizing transposase RayT